MTSSVSSARVLEPDRDSTTSRPGCRPIFRGRGSSDSLGLPSPRCGRIRRVPAAGFGRTIQEKHIGEPSSGKDQRRWRPLRRPNQPGPDGASARGLAGPPGVRHAAASDAEVGRSEVAGSPDPRDRPRAVRPDRPRASALATRLVGRPVHGPHPGRPPGAGPALPVHRCPARPQGCRIDPAAPGRVSRRGRGSRPLVAECWRSRWRPRARRGRNGWPRPPGRPPG